MILAYHHVGQDTPASTSVTRATFKRQLDYLDRHDFHVWSLPRLIDAMRSEKTVPPRTVALTFDDAYASVYTQAYPLLKKRGWPFTVFVTPEYIDGDYTKFVDWQQLRTMASHGATIGNHSLNHPHMVARAGRSRSEWQTAAKHQILGAQRRLEQKLEAPARIFAWPYGEFSPPLQALLSDLGFVGLGQQSGAIGAHSDFTALPRYPFNRHFSDPEQFALKVRSRALPVTATRPESGILHNPEAAPTLTLTLAAGPYRLANVHCYVHGERVPVEPNNGTPSQLRIELNRVPSPGRTKVNCTTPATDADNWLWYSFLWMQPRPDGRWYRD